MDLNEVQALVRPASRAALPAPVAGDAFLAGGTFLFSEPQPGLARLIDLQALGWPALAATDAELCIAATCTLAQLEAFEAPPAWQGCTVFGPVCRALWGSFKIRAVATVGGNMCLALPAGPMAAFAVGFGGACDIWLPDGGARCVAAADFITGERQTVLRAGELLRAVRLPASHLVHRAACRQASLSAYGRSACLLVGVAERDGVWLTITGAVAAPLRLFLPQGVPDLERRIDAAAAQGWYDDVHGLPEWRRHMTMLLAREILEELAGA